MKNFLINLIVSLITAVITFGTTSLFTTPLIIYDVKDRGQLKFVYLSNIGFSSAHNVALKIEFDDTIDYYTDFERIYWIDKNRGDQFLLKDSTLLEFNDLGELDIFQRNEEFNLEIYSDNQNDNYKISSSQIKVNKFKEAWLLRDDEYDSIKDNIFWAGLVATIVILAFSILLFNYFTHTTQT